jgi:phosphoribosyl 1,2-cyclic phosphate phosphodiesterase
VPKTPFTTEITGQLVVLGTGTSVGVPAVGCGCDVCLSSNPRNQRLRCSVILGLPEGNLLIDTSPDLRTQLLREKIGIVHAVAYTHEHSDHVMGLDDLRLMQFYLGAAVPLYCEDPVEQRIRAAFAYAFEDDAEETHVGATPQLEFHRIGDEPFEVLGAEVIPIRLSHGPRFDVLGFRVGNVAYCTDTNGIPDSSWPLLEGLDVLILDALRSKPHVTHFNLQAAVEVARQLQPGQTYFTHVCHDLDYETTNRELPDRIELAYDGLRFELT